MANTIRTRTLKLLVRDRIAGETFEIITYLIDTVTQSSSSLSEKSGRRFCDSTTSGASARDAGSSPSPESGGGDVSRAKEERRCAFPANSVAPVAGEVEGRRASPEEGEGGDADTLGLPFSFTSVHASSAEPPVKAPAFGVGASRCAAACVTRSSAVAGPDVDAGAAVSPLSSSGGLVERGP